MERLTNLDPMEMEAFFQLLPRIFTDYRDPNRGPFKLIYVFSQTVDNEASTFPRAVQCIQAGMTDLLGIAEGDLGHGYAGYDHSVDRLRTIGLKSATIIKFDVGGNVNTGAEAVKIAEYARAHKGDIGIIAPPFHLVRAFMTTVTALAGHPTHIHAIPGMTVPWMAQTVHSQGMLRNTRAGLLGDELVRLEKYRAPEFGSMFSAREVLNYLNWRDT
jgi:hypothetical protein